MRWVRGLEQRQRQRQRSGSGAQGVASLRILVWLQPACRCWPRPASSAKLEHNCSTTCRSNACTGCNAAGATLRDCMCSTCDAHLPLAGEARRARRSRAAAASLRPRRVMATAFRCAGRSAGRLQPRVGGAGRDCILLGSLRWRLAGAQQKSSWVSACFGKPRNERQRGQSMFCGYWHAGSCHDSA